MTAFLTGAAPPAARGGLPLGGRVLALVLGAAALFTGVWAGLTRLGAAPLGPAAPMEHGPLMVGGFLGVVIALERAVAARARWALAGPLLCGAGTAALLAGRAEVGAVLLALGSAVVVAVLVEATLREPALHHAVLTGSAIAWLLGNALLALGHPGFEVVPFWLLFLVGTIAAERLELNRLLPRGKLTRGWFLLGIAALALGALLSLAWRDAGLRLLAAGEVALALWMLRYDIARRTVRQPGAVRFIAVALLSGYLWLFVGGALGLWLGNPAAGPLYDAVLHAVLVGFVFSMIFGHALVILPAVLGVRLPFKGRFYLHLGLLHLGLLARVGGDLSGLDGLRRAGAWLNAAAIALFLLSSLAAAVSGVRTRPVPLAAGASR